MPETSVKPEITSPLFRMSRFVKSVSKAQRRLREDTLPQRAAPPLPAPRPVDLGFPGGRCESGVHGGPGGAGVKGAAGRGPATGTAEGAAERAQTLQ